MTNPVVTFITADRARKAIYCVSPDKTVWDDLHEVATIPVAATSDTPVLLRDGVQVKPIPAWLAFTGFQIFTVPGTIYISPALTRIPAETLVHECVHDYHAHRGAARYWWSVVSGVVIGAVRALWHGGNAHEYNPIEVEARLVARVICERYAGAPAPLDAAAEIARRLA